MSGNSSTNNQIQINDKTAAQLLSIINNSNQEVMNRIPKGFIRFLEIKTKNTKEEVIDFNNPNWEDELEEETQVYLALIYRDYIVTKEERKALIEEEKKLRKLQNLNEKYAINNPKEVNEINETTQTTQTTSQIDTVNTNETEKQDNPNNPNNTETINENEEKAEENAQDSIEEKQDNSKAIIETEEKLNWFQKILKKLLRL